MKRYLLCLLFVVILGANLAATNTRKIENSTSATQGSIEKIIGKWYLIDIYTPDTPLPEHRMDVIFTTEGGDLKGAIIDLNNGTEIPLAKAQYVADVLELQMIAPKGKEQSTMPRLVMEQKENRFEGYWVSSTKEKMGQKLKLIRFKH